MIRNTIIRTLIGSAAIFGLALFCITSIYIYKLFVPAQVDTNTSNIVQADIDRARALWESKDIHEYEYTVVVEAEAINATIHVNRDTGESALVGRTGALGAIPGVICCELVSFDKLLDLASTKIVEVNNGTIKVPGFTEHERYIDLAVKFDPQLGYPTELLHYTRTTRGNREVTWRQVALAIEIKDVRIIR